MKPTFLSRFSDILMFIVFIAIYASLFIGLYHPLIGCPIFACSIGLGGMLENETHNKKNSENSQTSV